MFSIQLYHYVFCESKIRIIDHSSSQYTAHCLNGLALPIPSDRKHSDVFGSSSNSLTLVFAAMFHTMNTSAIFVRVVIFSG
jgi:hypothetical protein